MALATRGPGFCQDDVVRAEWGMARDLGIPITVHIAMGKLAGKWSMVKQLDGLGPARRRHHVHPLLLLQRRGVGAGREEQGTISIAPQVEMQMGHGWPPVMKARSYGLRPSLSIDVVTTVPGDMFTEMRCAFAAERWKSNDSVWESEEPLPDDALTARDMLTMATLDGAHVAGLEDRTGSLTPGQAGRRRRDRRERPRDRAGHRPGRRRRAVPPTPSNVDTVIVGGDGPASATAS